MKNKFYLFDFDGTLMDSMPTVVSSVLRVLDDNSISYGNDLIKTIIPLGLGGTAEYYINHLGLKIPKEQAVSLMQEYMLDGYFYSIQPKNNVHCVLKKLKAQGASLNILTASPHITIDACLKRLGMWELFDNIWSCDDFATTKADPQIYARAAEKMGTTLANVLFLDDNLGSVTTGKAAGMQVCGVYDSYSEDYKEQIKEIADFYIYNFTELLEL